MDGHSYESRLKKYSKKHRCFRTFIPYFDKNMISNYVYKLDIKDETVNPIVKLLMSEKHMISDEVIGDGYNQSHDKNKGNMAGYNTVFFKRCDTIDESLRVLKEASNNILINLKIRNKYDSVTTANKFFKTHDLNKHPIFLKFDNIKHALIHTTSYDPKLEGTFFINGPTFSMSTFYEFANDKVEDELLSHFDKFIHKNDLTEEYDYGDIYFTQENADNINKILSGNGDSVVIPSKLGRDENGTIYMQAAILANNVTLISKFIENKYNIYEKLNDGSTPVHLAIRKHRNDIMMLFVEHIKTNDVKTVKHYDENRCNLIHYCVMFGNETIFNVLRDNFNVPLSDISWSIQFHGQDQRRYKRHSKYLCCAKFCMMFGQYDILKSLLDKYKGYDDFKYMFVDSDSSSNDPSDIIDFCIEQRDSKGLQILMSFFKKHDIYMSYSPIHESNKRTYEPKLMDVLFALEKFVTDKRTYVIVANDIIKFLHQLYTQKDFLKVFLYIDRHVPKIWTSYDFSKIHDKIQFNNIFGNKYVDTQKGLQAFAIIKSCDIENIKKMLPEVVKTLHYGLYIYDTNKNTVLSLCKNDVPRLKIVLDNLSEKISNKTGSYSENIINLLGINTDVLLNFDTLKVLIEHEIHGENVLKYVRQHAKPIVEKIFNKTNRDTISLKQFVEFIELFVNHDVIKDYDGFSAVTHNELHNLEFKVPLQKLTEYEKEIKSNDKFKTLDVKFPSDTYIGSVKDHDDLSILMKYNKNLLNEIDIDKHQHMIYNSAKLAYFVFDHNVVNVDNNKEILFKSLSWSDRTKIYFVKFLNETNSFGKIMKDIDFDKITKKIYENNRKNYAIGEYDYIGNTLKHLTNIINKMNDKKWAFSTFLDENNNTIFHSLASYNVKFIKPFMHIFTKDTSLITNKNKNDLSVLDYVERSLNDTKNTI